MGDVDKLECTKALKDAALKLEHWIMQHQYILVVFQAKVKEHFQEKMDNTTDPKAKQKCKTRMTMLLFRPNSTRMLGVFQLLFRIYYLKDCILAMFGDAKYKSAAQKAMAAYNCKDKNKNRPKYTKRGRGNQGFIDPLASLFSESSPIWDNIDPWLKANVATVYFHRIVDTHAPSLHFVYYCSALIDKHLRLLHQLDANASWIQTMFEKFTKRWTRWHMPIHTAAYHVNPQFQKHGISQAEMKDIRAAMDRLDPANADAFCGELRKFKGAHDALTTAQWGRADTVPAHEWWTTTGERLELGVLEKWAAKVCSLASAASVAEQGVVGWSRVGAIESERRTRLVTSKTNKLVNVNGHQWALRNKRKAAKLPRTMELFDTLDAMLVDEANEAKQAGLAEGEDDPVGYGHGADGDVEPLAMGDDLEPAPLEVEEDDEPSDVRLRLDRLASLEADDPAAEALHGGEGEYSESESDDDATETDTAADAPAPATLPRRVRVVVNDALKAKLDSLVDLRGSDFEVTRRLAFA